MITTIPITARMICCRRTLFCRVDFRDFFNSGACFLVFDIKTSRNANESRWHCLSITLNTLTNPIILDITQREAIRNSSELLRAGVYAFSLVGEADVSLVLPGSLLDSAFSVALDSSCSRFADEWEVFPEGDRWSVA